MFGVQIAHKQNHCSFKKYFFYVNNYKKTDDMKLRCSIDKLNINSIHSKARLGNEFFSNVKFSSV
jgi:hypothetical protein